MATPSSILRRPPTNIDFMSTPSSSDAMPNTATTTTRESRRSLASRVTASITALISPRRPISAPVQAPSATLVQSRIEELKITSAVAPRFIQVKPKDHIPEKLDDKIQEQIRHLRCISSADQLPMTPHGTTLEKFKATFAIATHHMDVTQDAIETLPVTSQLPVSNHLGHCKELFEIVELNLNIIESNLERLSLSQENPSMTFRPGFGEVAYAIAAIPTNPRECHRIQEGSFGSTSLVVHSDRDETHYVTKRSLHPDSKSVIDIFAKETNTNYTLPIHPGIMKFYGVNKQGHHLIEYIPGGELLDSIIGRTLNCQQKYNIAKKLAEAIAFLHENGLIHCDLKPENIMLTRELDPKLIDFGTCRSKFESSDITWFIGTNEYMAPEMLHPPAETKNNKIDVWSYGYTLYCMLSEKFLYDDLFKAYKKQRSDDSTIDTIKQFLAETQGTLEIKMSEALRTLNQELKSIRLSKEQREKLYLVLTSCLKLDPTKRATMEEITHIFNS